MLQTVQPQLLALPESTQSRALPRRPASVHLLQSGQITTALSGPEAADRQELEQYIHDIFARAHGANIRHYLPQLMSLRDEGGKLLAVCGLRHAEDEKLFLEHYLDAPVEHILQRQTGYYVPRGDIVEIGNLAVADPIHARSLLASVSLYLHGTNTWWGVFTGLATLRNSLFKLGMNIHVLAEAGIADLPLADQADWGSYYADGPHVMAVRRTSRPQEGEMA